MSNYTGYGIGDRFDIESTCFGGTYLLAQVEAHSISPGSMVCLIDTVSGNRWCDPVLVHNNKNLTQEEWNAVLGNYGGRTTTATLQRPGDEESSEEDRFDRLRCLQEASSGNTHMTPDRVVQRAQKFFEFVKYGR